jgi:tetratricopeptide (TPR) repeat protein
MTAWSTFAANEAGRRSGSRPNLGPAPLPWYVSGRSMDATAQDLVARLRRNPEDSEAFGALRAHYQRTGDYASLANLLEGWAGRARDKGAGAHALYEAGELVLGALADRERAVKMYERALLLEPRHQDAYLRLRGLFEEQNEMRRLAELLERQAVALQKAGADARDVALLYHQLGEIWEQRFTRVDKAVHHYRRAFELDPAMVPAIYAAREIYRAAGNLKAAATLLEKEAKAEPDPGRRIALWRELAHTKAEQLDDVEGAALALKRALADAPGDLEVIRDLAGIYLARAARTDDEHVRANDRHRAADLLFQMSQRLGSDDAMAYLEQALDARPDHEGSLAAYERLADDAGETARLPGRWVAYLALAPDRPEASARRKRLAEAYLAVNQIEYAVTCLEWLLDEGDPEAAERLVDLYKRQGREDDAMRALGVAARGMAPEKRVPMLRELVESMRNKNDLAGAAVYAREILHVDPSDPEALNLLEDACRISGDYAPLREALLAASRVSGLAPEARKQRLKEVAALSELKLGDLDGAVSAWRGVAALDPVDREARAALKRLLTAAQRWDDLVDILDREALSITEPELKADLFRQLAHVHRDRRNDLEAAIEALRHLRDLMPGDREGRDALCDALLGAGATLEAIPLLRQRVEDSSGDARAEQLRTLATVLEENVGDEEGAFDAWARLLDERPNDLDALGHMEAIDAAAGRHERLLSTLSYRVEVIEPGERPAVLVRMAQIAEVSLGDLDRAAELYNRARELVPRDASVLDALSSLYDRAERYRDLIVLLRDTARAEESAARRAELYRRIARALADRVGNDDAAAEAWQEVLGIGEDEEALRFLRAHAQHKRDPVALEDAIRRLAALVNGTNEVRELLLERAELLAEQLARPKDAITVLRRVVDEIAPDHVVALGRLAALCERTGDLGGLANALWRQLALIEDPGLRVPLARRLSDLHEREAPDDARAIEALDAWADADLGDTEPLSRLVPLLERTARYEELCSVLDRLAELENDEAEISRLWRRSAEVAYRQRGDVAGAWKRLEPRVREGDAGAENDLRELAKSAKKGGELAELYVSLAQAAADPSEQKQRWRDAGAVYESYLRDAGRALEAVLRAFAVDLSDRSCLSEADRLAEVANMWPRLGQVYETLIKRTEGPDEKIALLLRHAQILDERAKDPSLALDQTLRACSLAPLDDSILALAEDRAPRANRADELLVTYDKRKQRASDDAARIESLMRSMRLSEITLADRERATHYLAQAIALTVRTPELSKIVEATAADLDRRGKGGLRRAIVDIETRLAEDMESDPVRGSGLLLRAARLLREELRADDEAFKVLERAATIAPSSDDALDALEGFARQLGKLAELDRRLATLVEDALDGKTAGGLLRRRGRLLEELGRYVDAAEVWTKRSSMAPNDTESRERVQVCLRKAGQFQDLLVALQRDVRKAGDVTERLSLLKQIARVWEEDLGNKWEALDAWKKLAKESADDPDVVAALARLANEKKRAASEDSDVAIIAPRTVPPPQNHAPAAILAAPDSDGDEYADMTDPSEEKREADSSETVMDTGLYAEFLAAQAAALHKSDEDTSNAKRLPPPRRAPAEVKTEPPIAPPIAPPAAKTEPPLPPPLAPKAAPPLPVSMPLSGVPQVDDFDEDYTHVADDMFDELQASLRTPAREPVEKTGDLAIEDLVPADLVGDSDVHDVDDLAELEDVDDVEELDGLEDMEELDAPRQSAPPPTPGRRRS